MQLYSLATPNGVKATVMLEELLELGFEGAEYDAHLVRITEGEQFGSGFVEANPKNRSFGSYIIDSRSLFPAFLSFDRTPPTP